MKALYQAYLLLGQWPFTWVSNIVVTMSRERDLQHSPTLGYEPPAPNSRSWLMSHDVLFQTFRNMKVAF